MSFEIIGIDDRHWPELVSAAFDLVSPDYNSPFVRLRRSRHVF
jgi:hypothetical protein